MAELKMDDLSVYEKNILTVYAKRYRQSVEDFLATLNKYPGETLLEKINAFEEERRGLVVDAHLVDGMVFRDPIIVNDTDLYKVQVYVQLDRPDAVASALNMKADELSGLIPVGILFRNRSVAQRVSQLPLGSRVTLQGFSTSSDPKTGRLFFNARNVSSFGIDYEWLEQTADTVDDLLKTAFNEGDFDYFKFDGIFAVDPSYTVSSTGKPVVRVYLGSEGTVQVDFYGQAADMLKRLGNPYDPKSWEGKKFYVGATYSGDSGDIRRFSVFKKSWVVGPR